MISHEGNLTNSCSRLQCLDRFRGKILYHSSNSCSYHHPIPHWVTQLSCRALSGNDYPMFVRLRVCVYWQNIISRVVVTVYAWPHFSHTQSKVCWIWSNILLFKEQPLPILTFKTGFWIWEWVAVAEAAPSLCSALVKFSKLLSADERSEGHASTVPTSLGPLQIRHGAHLDAVDQDLNTPLHVAVR